MPVYIGKQEIQKVYAGKTLLTRGNKGTRPFFSVGGGVFRSAADILAANPSAASGIYSIQPDPNQPAFDAYCDMDNEGGGWTLVLSGGDTQFGHDSTFWDGTNGSAVDFAYSGSTFNTTNSETIIANMEFSEMRVDYNLTERSVLTSATTSTFAAKKAAQTAFTAQSGQNLNWNPSDGDGYSRGNFLLGGQGGAAGYGDNEWYFVGGTSWGYSYYGHGFYYQTFSETCGRSERCDNSSFRLGTSVGRQGHRYSSSGATTNLWFR